MGKFFLTIVSAHKDDHKNLMNTLDSLAHQTVSYLECVVIDGSSNQKATQELCKSYGNLSLRLIQQDPQGVYAAMNLGLDQAKGRFISFLNAGDTLYSPRVLRDLKPLLVYLDPVWLYADVQYVDSRGKKRYAPHLRYSREKRRNFRLGNHPLHPATFVRTETLRQIGGFDLSMKIAADYKVLLTLSKLADPLYWPQIAIDFQLGGLSSRRWVTANQESHRARCEVFELSALERQLDMALSLPVYARAFVSRALRRV